MAEISRKARDGKTVKINPGHYDNPEDAARALEAKLEQHGGPAPPAKPKRYTKRPISPSVEKAIHDGAPHMVAAAALPLIEEPRGIEWYLEQARSSHMAMIVAFYDLCYVRWVWYTVIAAAKKGEQAIAAGKGALLKFGRYGVGQHLLVDPDVQARIGGMAMVASL